MENINILPNVLKGELNMERYLNTHKEWIDSTWEKLDKKLSKVAITSRDFIPYTTKNGKYITRDDDINWWTNGFLGGLVWLMYIGTKNEEYKITAERHEDLLDKAFEKHYAITHSRQTYGSISIS